MITFQPHLTAITRKAPSKMARYVIDEYLSQNYTAKTILDYGCGKGSDLNHYKKAGLIAVGYDPYGPFNYDVGPHGLYDIITIAFVLNVIPHRIDRIKVIEKATQHLRQKGIMLIMTRSHDEIRRRAIKGKWKQCIDGFISYPSKGTFQKGIDEPELIGMGREVGLCGCITHTLSLSQLNQNQAAQLVALHHPHPQ